MIYIGDTPVEVTEAVPNSSSMGLAVHGGGKFVISDKESTEILPKVFFSVGRSRNQGRGGEKIIPRVVIEAPREVVVLRAELYERQNA